MKQQRKNIFKEHLDKKVIRRVLSIICVFVLVVQLGGGVVYAETISSRKGNMTITTDSQYIYFAYEGKWVSYLSDQIVVSNNGGQSLAALSKIVIAADNVTETGEIRINDAWGSKIPGASGVVRNSNKNPYYGYKDMQWNIKVPKSTYVKIDEKELTFTWGGQSVTCFVKDNVGEKTTEVTTENDTEEKTTEVTTENDTEEKTTEVTTENNTEEKTTEVTTESNTEDSDQVETRPDEEIVVSSSVQIDGLYDDWDGLPKTEIEYDPYTQHYGQMFTDGTNIYAHFKTSNRYTDQINIHLWYLTINGKTFDFRIWPAKDGKIDWGAKDPQKAGTYTNLKVFIGYDANNECGSNVAYTIYDTGHGQEKPGDDIEFSFSLERLSEITGIPVDQMGVITLSNPNLGTKGVTIAGSSTGPIASVGIAFILAFAFFKKKKEMKKI